MLPSKNVEVVEYLGPGSRSPYAEWFNRLNAPAATKVTIAATRLSQGNFSNAKAVGGGIFEYKIDFGPGYRMYFGRDGQRVILLLGGGTKKRQQKDIADALSRSRLQTKKEIRRVDKWL